MITALEQALNALQGFFTIGVLIGLGWLLAKAKVLNLDHRRMMSHLALYVASPALMFVTMVQADLTRVFATSVLASYGAIVVVAVIYLVVAARRWRHDPAGRTIGVLLSCYSNAGNLGIPVAAYALGDVTWIAPILLIQMVLLQPIALGVLDAAQARRQGRSLSLVHLASLPLRNPLTLGVLAGLAFNLVQTQVAWFALPDLVLNPIAMLGDVAVPLMLLAFGVSVCLDPRPTPGADRVESWFLVLLKVVVQPIVAFGLAHWVLGLDPVTQRAVTVVACLPPAQNIFIFAARYDQRLVFARDTIFRATLVAVITILLAATVLA